jgi:integrase
VKKLAYVTSFKDRHGKTRHRFRRKGYPTYYFKNPAGTKLFEQEYAACMQAELPKASTGRIKPGSVSDVIQRYYQDTLFLDLKPATQTVYRGVLERFRASFGDVPMRTFDAEQISKLMTAMRATPHAAARLRKLLGSMLRIARRAKLVPHGFDPIRDTSAPKAETKGYHRLSEDELEQFEAKHPLGTKPRLAFDLLLYGAQRSGDVREMTHDTIAGGRIPIEQNKTANVVDVPIVEPLRASIAAGPLGKVYLLEDSRGGMYSGKTFYQMLKKAFVQAALPHCSPHGLRKSAARRCLLAGCSDEEGMAITGHKTVKEYRRYAGEIGRGVLADAAMGKVMAARAPKAAE